MTDLHITQCDGCDKRTPIRETSGWFNVQQVVTSEAEYTQLVLRAHETGISGAISGDFCSLECLSRWAGNAALTKGMEP